MQRQLSYEEIERSSLLREIRMELSRFSVGFVKIVDLNGKEDVTLAGSGTFVQAQERFGILTADHVLQNLTGTQIGVILPTLGQGTPHRVDLRAKQCRSEQDLRRLY